MRKVALELYLSKFQLENGSPSSALSHPFFGWEGSLTKIDHRKNGTLIATSLLEDLVENGTPKSYGGSYVALLWVV